MMNSEDRKLQLWPWDFDEYPIWFSVHYDSGPSGYVPCYPIDDPNQWEPDGTILVRCSVTFADGSQRLAEAEVDVVEDIWYVYALHFHDDDGELAASIDLNLTKSRECWGLAEAESLNLQELLEKTECEIFPLRVEVIGRRPDYAAIEAAREILSIDQVIPSLRFPGIP